MVVMIAQQNVPLGTFPFLRFYDLVKNMVFILFYFDNLIICLFYSSAVTMKCNNSSKRDIAKKVRLYNGSLCPFTNLSLFLPPPST